jgi:hypothetical protein
VLFALDGTSYEIDLLAKNAPRYAKRSPPTSPRRGQRSHPRGARRRRATEPAESRPGFATLTTYGWLAIAAGVDVLCRADNQ